MFPLKMDKDGDFFQRYVSLPEGIMNKCWEAMIIVGYRNKTWSWDGHDG